MQSRQTPVMRTPAAQPLTHDLSVGYARQAIRLERALGWVLWIGLALVLVFISF